jgi:uncharacterized repeat protein (TIGR01451 family)
MKSGIISILAVLISLGTSGQCYHIQQRPYYPDPYSGGVEYQLPDDAHTGIVDLGFPFCFFGDTVTQCVISSNGYITFDSNQANMYSPWNIGTGIPSPTVPMFSIMAPWQDTNPSAGGSIRSATYGVPPYRRFVVSYDAVAMFSCTTLVFTNQIVLYESLNVVDVNITEKPVCTSWNQGNAIEGIHNQDGTEGYAVTGRNYPEQWTAQNDSYRFIPLCDCPTDSLPGFGIVPGKVFWDENSNCDLDQGELLLPNIQLDIQPGNGIAWTNQNGEFGVVLEPGNYTIEHSSQNPWYYINDCQPNGIPITVVEDSNAVNVCFADSIVPVADLSATIITNQINACFLNNQIVTVCNEGTVPVTNVEVTVGIPDFTGTSNPNFTATSDSTWSLTIPALYAGECNTYQFWGTAVCDSSMIGQVACLSVELENVQNDIDLSNNQMSFCDSVGASYDPNDIRVLSQNQEEGWRTQEYIDDDDEMTYMVRFQNTGTGPAYNVIVHNPLSQYLDHQSVELIAASHDYYAQMIDGELRLHFLGIELPDSASDPVGSQGFFIYRISQESGNPLGTLIENQAEIYFDFNAPVATNTTDNEILLLTSTVNLEMGKIDLYPNPTTGEVLISNSNPQNSIESIEVLDLQGRLLISESQAGISHVDLGKLRKGIYLVRIETEMGTVVKRMIKN